MSAWATQLDSNILIISCHVQQALEMRIRYQHVSPLCTYNIPRTKKSMDYCASRSFGPNKNGITLIITKYSTFSKISIMHRIV